MSSNTIAKRNESLPPADAEGAINTLTKMAEKPKVTPFQEVIQRAKEQIIAAFHQGYTRQDICDAMQEHGIKVTPRMLIEYVPEVRGGRTPKRMITKRVGSNEAVAEFGDPAQHNGAAIADDADEPETSSTEVFAIEDELEPSIEEEAAPEATPKKPVAKKAPAKSAAKSSARSATAKTQRKPLTKSTTTKTTTKRSTTNR